MMGEYRKFFGCLLLGTLWLNAAAEQAPGEGDARQIGEVHQQIAEFENAWNRGDIAGVIRLYHPSVDVMASGERWGYSKQVEFLEELMKKEPRQQLRFDTHFIRALGGDHAVVNGRFRLISADGSEESGPFSAIWMRSGERWQCIYSHS